MILVPLLKIKVKNSGKNNHKQQQRYINLPAKVRDSIKPDEIPVYNALFLKDGEIPTVEEFQKIIAQLQKLSGLDKEYRRLKKTMEGCI